MSTSSTEMTSEKIVAELRMFNHGRAADLLESLLPGRSPSDHSTNDALRAEIGLLRVGLAKIASLVDGDHQGWSEQDSALVCAQKRGGTIDRISEVILDLDDTLFDVPKVVS